MAISRSTAIFTNAENLNHVDSKKDHSGRSRAYVGDLKFNRKVEWKGKTLRVDQFAAAIPPEDRKELRRGDKRQWCFTCTLHIPKVNHKVRIVIIWNHRRDHELRKILVTNRTTWGVCRVVRTYRDRWTGTKTYHRDGKQQLGMGDCQLRDGQVQTRHMYLVMLAYSLLMRQLRQDHAHDWALCKLKTIGEACRAMLNETLRATINWVIEQVRDYERDADHVLIKLRLV